MKLWMLKGGLMSANSLAMLVGRTNPGALYIIASLLGKCRWANSDVHCDTCGESHLYCNKITMDPFTNSL